MFLVLAISRCTGMHNYFPLFLPLDTLDSCGQSLYRGASATEVSIKRGGYMNQQQALVVFEGKEVRRTWFTDEWWFVAVDIVETLTDSKDPNGYLKDMRRRDESFAQGWGQIATPLPIDTAGGKQNLNCVSVKGAFRLIQSIPSPKAERYP